MALVPFLQQTSWVDVYGEDFRSLTPAQRKFLQVYPYCFTISAALEKCKLSPTNHQNWMTKYPVYRRVFESVEIMVTNELEQEAIRRAAIGMTKKIYFKGQVCGEEQVYSDQLLMFVLRARKPDVYRERSSIELTQPPSPPEDSQFRGISKEGLIQMKQIIAQERERQLRSNIQIEGKATEVLHG